MTESEVPSSKHDRPRRVHNADPDLRTLVAEVRPENGRGEVFYSKDGTPLRLPVARAIKDLHRASHRIKNSEKFPLDG